MKIDAQMIFDINRLNRQGWRERKIARYFGISRQSVRKYIQHPHKKVVSVVGRPSKLDPFRDLIAQFVEQDPHVEAPVVLQRLEAQGFDGKVTIVRDYLRQLRGQRRSKSAFLCIESPPGKELQIDWGHFGQLEYNGSKRKLYALAVVESYSRMMYVEFTHSQKQADLHQCLLNAFIFFNGTPEKIVVDNMLTAVTERQGSLVRFNGAFLEFLQHFQITPVACHVRAPYEKGKVEGAIKFIRRNFWPLRTFTDIFDVALQVRDWLSRIANVRMHQTTGCKPSERFASVRLKPLPELLPDCRETFQTRVYKNFSIRFDDNDYTAPPWTIGKTVTVKADLFTVCIYLNQKRVAVHKRSFDRKKRIELPAHVEQVKKMKKQFWQDRQIAAFASLGNPAVEYLKRLSEAGQPIRKNVGRLLALKDEYGVTSLFYAIQKAMSFKAYGADYIENILYQEMTPKRLHLKVELKDKTLNNIRLNTPNLAEYDAYILKRRQQNDGKGN